jgi:hypothetical protein
MIEPVACTNSPVFRSSNLKEDRISAPHGTGIDSRAGRLLRAREQYEQVLELAQEVGDDHLVGAITTTLGI